MPVDCVNVSVCMSYSLKHLNSYFKPAFHPTSLLLCNGLSGRLYILSLKHLNTYQTPSHPTSLLVCTGTVWQGGERIGIAGRTGSGKSSLVVTLFRIVEPCGGRVTIDGVDALRVGLRDLREAISIIPQVSLGPKRGRWC